MGGTAQAYSSGLAGMMNNPATMGMEVKEGNLFQFAIGGLNPTISSEHKASSAKTDSSGSFIMPGFGYATKKDGLTWGVGVMAQGGMGTDYGKAGSGDLFAGGMSLLGTPTSLSGETVRSEVAVGRLIAPLAFEVNNKLTVGGSLDYVWGGMDLQMDMDGASFGQLMAGNGGSVGGSMATGLNASFGTGPGSGSGALNNVNWARFDFSDDSNFT
jgi:long-chain fatty acid transport protein